MSYQPIATAPVEEVKHNPKEEQHFVEEQQSYQQYEPQTYEEQQEIEYQNQQKQELNTQENHESTIIQNQNEIQTEKQIHQQEQTQLLQQKMNEEEYIKQQQLNFQTEGYSYQNSTPSIQYTPNSNTLEQVTKLGNDPQNIICPHCHESITTYCESSLSVVQTMLCILLFVFGFWCCCFIVFCIRSLSTVTHTCPHCKHIIGKKGEFITI